ncbi:MAG: RNA polymerase subunit sigma-24 [marine bacterium B5-7]|nr:MAG: RNA polymerase subunit sigma-24 [marine bacterium B5-7]
MYSSDDFDTELVEGLKKGDQASHKQLVVTYWEKLNYLARRILNDSSAANDCVQEALIKAIYKIDDFEGKGSFSGWLRRIVVNEALMALRKKKSRKEESIDNLMQEFDEMGMYSQPYNGRPISLDVLQESEAVRTQVRLAIDKLPDNFRITLLLRDIEGYTTKEVAKKMDVTEQNVKVRLHRARLALRNILAPILREEAE